MKHLRINLIGYTYCIVTHLLYVPFALQISYFGESVKFSYIDSSLDLIPIVNVF